MSSRPSSNTANSPQGPAPMISTSVLMTSLMRFRRTSLMRVLIWEMLAADARPRARHDRYACRSGVRTTRPSSSAVTLIWQDSREFGFTS